MFIVVIPLCRIVFFYEQYVDSMDVSRCLKIRHLTIDCTDFPTWVVSFLSIPIDFINRSQYIVSSVWMVQMNSYQFSLHRLLVFTVERRLCCVSSCFYGSSNYQSLKTDFATVVVGKRCGLDSDHESLTFDSWYKVGPKPILVKWSYIYIYVYICPL